MNRTRRFGLAVVAAVAVTACGTASADATTPPAATCHSVGGKTDRRCTPGAINPQVTQANIASTICRKGWTKTVRPPASYTSKLKRQQMRDYGLTGPPSLFEEDHVVPLELGGGRQGQSMAPAAHRYDDGRHEGRRGERPEQGGVQRPDQARRRPTQDRGRLGGTRAHVR